jgi:hypothetical protein
MAATVNIAERQRTSAEVPNRNRFLFKVEQGIQAARTIFGKCYFDAEKCADGYRHCAITATKSMRSWAPA